MRNGSLADLATMLEDQQARKYDLIVPSRAIHPFVQPAFGDEPDKFGLFIDGADFGGVDAEGNLTTEMLTVWPMQQCHDGFAERLGIPTKYYRRMLDDAPNLLVTNVRHWLDDMGDEAHMLRTFRDDSGDALGRALLSPRYNAIDHLDLLWGVLEGVRTACPDATISGADLSDKRMRIRISAPQIAVNIRDLVENYWPGGPGALGNGRSGAEYPLLFAGLVASNSETGNGAWTIAPRAIVQVCTNGMTREVDAVRRIHIGGRLEEGVINWAADTRQAQIDLIRNQARDAVSTFLSTDYLDKFRDDLYHAAGIEVHHAVRAVEHVRRTLSFTEEQGMSILSHFLASGDSSALGLAQAITHEAQTADDDLAYEAEAMALLIAEQAAVVR